MWGGVGAAVNAAEVYDSRSNKTYTDVLELTVNVLRGSTSSAYGSQYEKVDWTDGDWATGKKFLLESESGNLTTDMLRFVGSDGNLIDPYQVEHSPTDEFPCDGWFTIDGTPKKWELNGSHAICVKFFQALTPNNNGEYEYEITDMFTDLDDKTVSVVKWAIVNPDPDNERVVIYTFNIVYHTTTEETTYSHSLKVDEDPKLWGKYGWDGVIQMYMGGWKYQSDSNLSGVYNKTSSNYVNNSDTSPEELVDGWENADILTNYGANNITYYQYYFKDNNIVYREKSYGDGHNANARSEFLEKGEPGKYMHTFAKRGNEFGKGNPFTVPCFGTFLKFEPEQNGTVTLYIVQNGIIDLSESGGENGGLQKKTTWRPTYIVDELGNLLTDDKDGVTAELPKVRSESSDKEGQNAVTDDVGQKIYIRYDGTYLSTAPIVESDKSKVAAFVDGIPALRDNVIGKTSEAVWTKLTNEYWKTGGSEMKMMPPSESQDGWIAINKTYVKYTFPVKAGKSYYVFNNDSQIAYCGYRFAGEGMPTGTINIDDQNYEHQPGCYKAVTVTRSFKQGWNAICLPFSVTESKMRAVFGSNGTKEDYELVTYNGCKKTSEESNGIPTTENGLTAHFFRHAYQDIIAGYPYMIYIPKDAPALSGESVTFYDVTIEDDVEMATFNNSTEYMGTPKKNLSTETDFTFKGTYVPETIPAGSYVVYSSITTNNQNAKTGIRYLEEDAQINGLRSYLYPEYRYQTPEPVKAVARITGTNFSDVLDESIWNDATVINSLIEEMGFFDQKENVYSITGQLVRQNSTSLVGLPKGIYIVKGKKYFVK